ncbi:transcription initiation factor IID, 31kD subunit-domain-containing protein [Scheffersomyces xylosifermentans]|uniref:transcription initiation factor IID, 31kD subunit-domain-containing protein n=1 Tax=Scheffersomyces xylosifermentans TaxID=1304137 RepID=UPI00315DC557
MSTTTPQQANGTGSNATNTDGANSAQTQTSVVPRDVRLLHLIFATQGIQNYQDHVPLQLMDFAHRYTKSVLKDAIIYSDHAKPMNTNLNTTANSTVNTDDIRLAIAARTNYQFKPTPPKELLLELAEERNSKSLPPVIPKWGLNLPPEKYCLTARDWDNIDDEPEGDEQEKKKQKSS